MKLRQIYIVVSFYRIVSFADYVEELGHPYMWVQNLGGLHFPSDSSEVRACARAHIKYHPALHSFYVVQLFLSGFRVCMWAVH